jgi:hypothetical protein
LELNKIDYTLNNFGIYILNLEENNSIVSIDNFIKERNILFNVDNISYDPSKNNFLNYHYDIKYLNDNIFILTIINFNNRFNDKEYFILNINNVEYSIILNINNKFSKKQTFFIRIHNNLKLYKSKHINRNFNIFQTFNTNNIDINKFYTINTILNYLPDIKYEFYNEENRIQFIISNYDMAILNIYNKLIPGAYKADLFRILYLYKNGGLYMDCKNILYKNINKILDKNECYVRDLGDGVYNAFIYCSYSNNNNFKEYICAIIYNVFNSLYTDNGLSVTGPQLMINFFKENIYLKNTHYDNNWKRTYLSDFDENIIIKNSYEGYYDNDNYLNRSHYSVLYEQHNIYNNVDIKYNKINGIDYILWINFLSI